MLTLFPHTASVHCAILIFEENGSIISSFFFLKVFPLYILIYHILYENETIDIKIFTPKTKLIVPLFPIVT